MSSSQCDKSKNGVVVKVTLEPNSYMKHAIMGGFDDDESATYEEQLEIRSTQYRNLEKGFYSYFTMESDSIVEKYDNATAGVKSTSSSSTSKDLDQALDRKEGKNQLTLLWYFSGHSKLVSFLLRIKDRAWYEKFSRMRLPAEKILLSSRHHRDHQILAPIAHQTIYKNMSAALNEVKRDEPRKTVVLSGAPGMGKSYCAQHYLYHLSQTVYQTVVWFSGESKEKFGAEWHAFAEQLRNINTDLRDKTDDATIQAWCEKKLSYWLFIIDNVTIDAEIIMKHLPKTGGNVLITTRYAGAWENLKDTTVLPFSPLSADDSKILMRRYIGSGWCETGRPQEEEALDFLAKALGGSPLALSQIAQLARKKDIPFERLRAQFKDSAVRQFILKDLVLGSYQDNKTFAGIWEGSIHELLIQASHYHTNNKFTLWLMNFLSDITALVDKRLSDDPICYLPLSTIVAWNRLNATAKSLYLALLVSYLPLMYDEKNACFGVPQVMYSIIPEVTNVIKKQSGKKIAHGNQTRARKEKKHASDKALSQIDIPFSDVKSIHNASMGVASLSVLAVDRFSEQKGWRLPQPNDQFIERKSLITKLEKALKYDKKTGARGKTSVFFITALSGMGGVGKTELAKHMIIEHPISDSYKRRFWMDASSIASIREEFRSLAERLNLIDQDSKIKDHDLIKMITVWLSKKDADWFMVLDNADEYNKIKIWIPQEGGVVLVTTRDPKPGVLSDEQIITVGVLDSDEAIDWLYHVSGRSRENLSEQEKKAAVNLVDQLGFLPLAIVQAGSYLSEHPLVPIAAYEKQLSELLLNDENAPKKTQNKEAYSRTVLAKTWLISLKAIETHAKEREIPNMAQKLFQLCAYLAPNHIPIAPLEQYLQRSDETASREKLAYWLDEYLGQLLKYSLLRRSDRPEGVSMHRLVQSVMRLRCEKGARSQESNDNEIQHNKPLDSAKRAISEVLKKAYDTQHDTVVMERLLPHAKVLVVHYKASPPWLNQTSEKYYVTMTIELLINFLGICNGNMMRHNKSLAYYREGFSLLNEGAHLGLTDVTSERIGYSSELITMGFFPEAKKQLLLIAKTHFDNPNQLSVCQVGDYYMTRAVLLQSLGECASAEHTFLQAIEWCSFAKYTSSMNKSYSNLGLVYGFLNEKGKQIELLTKAKRALSDHYESENHQAVLITQIGLADALCDAGYYTDATLEVQNMLDRHIFDNIRIPALGSLGYIQRCLGNVRKSIETLKKAVSLSDICDTTGNQRAVILANLGRSYQVSHQLFKAVQHYKQAYNIHQRGSQLTKSNVQHKVEKWMSEMRGEIALTSVLRKLKTLTQPTSLPGLLLPSKGLLKQVNQIPLHNKNSHIDMLLRGLDERFGLKKPEIMLYAMHFLSKINVYLNNVIKLWGDRAKDRDFSKAIVLFENLKQLFTIIKKYRDEVKETMIPIDRSIIAFWLNDYNTAKQYLEISKKINLSEKKGGTSITKVTTAEEVLALNNRAVICFWEQDYVKSVALLEIAKDNAQLLGQDYQRYQHAINDHYFRSYYHSVLQSYRSGEIGGIEKSIGDLLISGKVKSFSQKIIKKMADRFYHLYALHHAVLGNLGAANLIFDVRPGIKDNLKWCCDVVMLQLQLRNYPKALAILLGIYKSLLGNYKSDPGNGIFVYSKSEANRLDGGLKILLDKRKDIHIKYTVLLIYLLSSCVKHALMDFPKDKNLLKLKLQFYPSLKASAKTDFCAKKLYEFLIQGSPSSDSEGKTNMLKSTQHSAEEKDAFFLDFTERKADLTPVIFRSVRRSSVVSVTSPTPSQLPPAKSDFLL